MKIAKKALALFLCTIMLMSCLYVGGDLGFLSDSIKAYAAQEQSVSLLENIQNEDSPRLELDFGKNWKFNDGDVANASHRTFNDSNWRTVNLPHDFAIEREFTTNGTEVESGNLRGGTGWYRKTFIMPASYRGKSIVLTFDGAYNNTEVFVNGNPVATNKYGYNSFSIDISSYLDFDGQTKNTVAVKVISESSSSRWYPGAGIYRDVKMTVTNSIHVDNNGTFVKMPQLEKTAGKNGDISTSITVKNDADYAQSFRVHTKLIDANGKLIDETATQGLTLNAKTKGTYVLENTNKAPKLWNTEDKPALYTLRTEIYSEDNKHVIDSYDTVFGYRWVNWDAKNGFSLNGQLTKIKGVCMHHDQGALGAVQEHDALYRQMMILKDMGVNAVRTSHNSASEMLIKVCNEVGLMVMEEFFDGWNLSKNGNGNDFAKNFNAQADSRLLDAAGMTWAQYNVAQTVKRDRNAPSIIIWSAGNELNEGFGKVNVDTSISSKIRTWVHDFDDTRMLTFGNNTKVNGEINADSHFRDIMASMDVIGGNYNQTKWNGPYTKPFIGTETASAVNSRGEYNAVGNGNNDVKHVQNLAINSYDDSWVSWGNTAASAWNKVIRNDWNSGEFVWTGFDYIGEPTPWNNAGRGSSINPNSSYFGIIDTAGFGKDSYYLYRSMWNDKSTTLHLVPGTWNRADLEVKNGYVDVSVYSDADRIELFLDGQPIGSATSKTNTTAAGYTYKTWTEESSNNDLCKLDVATYGNDAQSTELYSQFRVKYTGAKLSVKAYKGGKEVTNEAVGVNEVSSAPIAKVVAKPWNNKVEYTADGHALIYVELEARTADDLFTPASASLNFKLTGNATIEGVDHGCQGSGSKFQSKNVLTSDKTAKINLFNGKALVILKTTEDIGKIVLNITANSNGSAIPVEGNTPNLLRSANKQDGKITVNAIEETAVQGTNEFEEVLTQPVSKPDLNANPAVTAPDGYVKILNPKNPTEDFSTVRFPTNMYLDMSMGETLDNQGYKLTLGGKTDKVDAHYGNGTDYRLVYFPSIWGGQSDRTDGKLDGTVKDNTFRVDAFNNYGITVTKDPGEWTKAETSWDKYKIDGKENRTIVDKHEKNYAYDLIFVALKGSPKHTGDFTYTTAGSDSELLVGQWWHHWEWNDFTEEWRQGFTTKLDTNSNCVVDKNGSTGAEITMTAHIYDKSPLRNGSAYLDIIKSQNSNRQEYLVNKGAWDEFIREYDPALVAETKRLLKTREVTQAEIDAVAGKLDKAVAAANKLEYRAHQQDLDNLKALVAKAESIVNSPTFEEDYKQATRVDLINMLNEVKNSKYIKTGITTHKVDANNFDTVNAGYKANAETIEMRQLLEDLQTAIDGLKATAIAKVNATLFKYGYNNNAAGNERYSHGGIYMNRITEKAVAKELKDNHWNEIGAIVDRVGRKWANGKRDAAINDAIGAYKKIYSSAFIDDTVANSGHTIARFDYDNGGYITNADGYGMTAWNIWCKSGTTAPGENKEEGASVQGLASPKLVQGANGEYYFTQHAPYPTLPYKNLTNNGGHSKDSYRAPIVWGNLAGQWDWVTLPALKNMSVFAPDYFKKEALLENGTPTDAKKGNFAKYYWDTELPLQVETRNGVNYYTFDSNSNDYTVQTTFHDDTRTADMKLTETPGGWSVNKPWNGVGRGFFPFNYQGDKKTFTGENAIFHYGLTFDTEFYIPESGHYDNQEDIIFEFTGDDDVYVYIDDTLVLDNGGLHGARKSTINFSDMSVSYQYAMDVSESTIKNGPKDPGKNEITYRFGDKNEGISADNQAALEKLEHVRKDGNSHTLRFYFLERGSTNSNCDINFNVKAASKDVKLNRQSYAIDFGATDKFNIRDNDVISDAAKVEATIEYMGISDLNPASYQIDHDVLEFDDDGHGHIPKYDYELKGRDTLEFTTKNGTYTFRAKDQLLGSGRAGDITFKSNGMTFERQDTFFVVSKITNDPSFAPGTVYYRYEPVYVFPATNIYYEDNHDAIDYIDGIGGDTGKWQTKKSDGTVIADTAKQDLVLDFEMVEKDIYGYNDGYVNFNTYSDTTAHEVTVSAKNNPNIKYSGAAGTKWPEAKFEFTGTGFDVISATSNKTGAVRVEVKDSTGKRVANRITDTYYGYSYGQLYMDESGNVTLTNTGKPVYYSVNGAYTLAPTHYEYKDGKQVVVAGAADESKGQKPALAFEWLQDPNAKEALYQIPVIKVKDLPYGKYSVTITPMYASNFSHGAQSTDFVLDAIRIYNPGTSESLIVDGMYNKHDQNHPVTLELRNKLIGKDAATVAGTEGIIAINGDALEGRQLESFTKGFPNHEIYLAKGNAIAFELCASEIPTSVKLAAKLLKGNPNLKVTCDTNHGTKTFNTATEMYYSLEDLAGGKFEWTKGNDGLYRTKTITIQNASNDTSVISLTNIELTFKNKGDKSANITAPTAKVMVRTATPMMALAAINRGAADLSVNKVAEPSVVRDSKGNAVVTMQVTTSNDADKLIVKNGYGAVAANANIKFTQNDGTKTWTIVVVENNVGNHNYTISAADVNGYVDEEASLEMTFTVKKMPIGFRAKQAIKNFFDKIFGRR